VVALGKAKRRLSSTTEDVRDRVSPVAGSARDSVGSVLDDTRTRLAPVIGEVKGRITPVIGDAKEKVAPAFGETRDRIAPVIEDARKALAPVAQQAIAGGRRGGRKAAIRLGLAEEPKQGHKLRNLLVLLGLSGAGFLAYKKFFGGGEQWSDAGESASGGAHSAGATAATPADRSAGVEVTTQSPLSAEAESGNETAPTAPLASEETVESIAPTTPDTPLEETVIEDAPPAAKPRRAKNR